MFLTSEAVIYKQVASNPIKIFSFEIYLKKINLFL